MVTMYNIDTPMIEIEMTVKLSNILFSMDIIRIRDFLNKGLHTYLDHKNVGNKTFQEITKLYCYLNKKFDSILEEEKTGSIYWKAKNDNYCYGILLKDGTVIQAYHITQKGLDWVDVEIECNPCGDNFYPFGKKPAKFDMFRDIISIRSEFIAAVCEALS